MDDLFYIVYNSVAVDLDIVLPFWDLYDYNEVAHLLFSNSAFKQCTTYLLNHT